MSGVEIVTVVIALILVLVVIWVIYVVVRNRRRSADLRSHFRSEYDRTVDQSGDRRRAERDLERREAQRGKIEVRELDGLRRTQYADQWQHIQSSFVDQPAVAVEHAYQLVRQVLAECGYPTDDAGSQADMVSVDHPDIIEEYRLAVASTEASSSGEATTEELRTAMIHYRSLFSRLLGTDSSTAGGQSA